MVRRTLLVLTLVLAAVSQVSAQPLQCIASPRGIAGRDIYYDQFGLIVHRETNPARPDFGQCKIGRAHV